MNIGPDNVSNEMDDGFDAKLRQAHAQAVEQVSPRTFVQLRPRQGASRTSPATRRLRAWPLAATCAIAFIAGGLFLRQPSQKAPESAPAESAIVAAPDNNEPADVYAALDESPELYLWLASNDTDPVGTDL